MKKVPNVYLKPDWATYQCIRQSGLVEDICEHGVGHPNSEYLRTHPKANSVHGCDGCCWKPKSKTPPLEVPKYDSNEPSYEAIFNFLQNSDTCQKEGMQKLKVEVVSSGTGHFLRLTTGANGWAINDPEDMFKLLKLVASVQSDNDQISGVKNEH
jgi:hypothetical protein